MATQKTVTFYECDICKKGYDTQAEATACESSHGTITIDRCQYGTSSNIYPLPEAIIITNGTLKAQYVYTRKVNTIDS